MRITFTDTSGTAYLSDTDLGLVISKVIVGEPTVKEILVDVPGADGSLDYSDFFGDPIYNNRQILIECGFVVSSRFDQESYIRNSIHGKKCRISLSEDSGYYYIGRVSVGDITKEVGIAHLQITCNCQPYKLKNNATQVQKYLTTSDLSITLSNEKKNVIPTITVSAETVLTIGSSTVTILTGTRKVLALVLKAGETSLSARVSEGTGTITFSYQEASL